ncbi:hypothetical protein CDAR_493761 [Caerostris darwini]|uniref:Secreted protein n=1 Tax=Caerostris darwini TaxID=1538125 RepID=A0AAV4VTT8_9ARAC|nr:hypothetical protein CDAR_493761 [Caerostris darwini]
MKSYWKVKSLLLPLTPSLSPARVEQVCSPDPQSQTIPLYSRTRAVRRSGILSLLFFFCCPSVHKATGECAKQSSHFTSFASISDDFV